MELNAEQIKKALECCATDDDCAGEQCPFYVDCQFCITRISKDALALIKELTDENEKIGIENFNLICELSHIKEDTVRKMQERLIAEFRKDDRMNFYLRKTLDQIAKEMLEGE